MTIKYKVSRIFTPLNKAADEIGGNKSIKVGGLRSSANDTYLTGFTKVKYVKISASNAEQEFWC
ncbi:hypothetical protein KAU19_07065 [Candidatus Parcubacteria bacterium]|nr:hypothetical protein [Candidatus Parcubacteria bacterium]